VPGGGRNEGRLTRLEELEDYRVLLESDVLVTVIEAEPR
jgi:hypothetical protein